MAVTPNLQQAVRKASERAAKLESDHKMDLQEIADCVREKSPDELNSSAEKEKRRDFLDSLYATGREAQQAFERIINGNELQDANFLPRGALVSRSVFRVVVRAGARVVGYGTGFLVGEGVLLTNNHVLQSADIARNSLAEAFFEYGLAGEDEPKQTFTLDVDKLFFTDKDLDFTVVALSPRSDREGVAVADLGWLPLIGATGKVMDGEWLTIVQHPQGERKQVCVRENQLIKRDDDVLWYSTDTLGGSSGSPVFNNDWLLVALHHSGVPETVNGKWQTVDGRDYDPNKDDESRIKWKANEGIRVSRIVQKLSTDPATAKHPLVTAMLDVGIDDVRARLPIMTRKGAQLPSAVSDLSAILPRTGSSTGSTRDSKSPTERTSTETSMATRLINVTLAVDEGGSVSVRDQSTSESFLLEGTTPKKKKNIIVAPVDPARDWVGGYDPRFLTDAANPVNDLIVPLPTVLDRDRIAPLLGTDPYTGKPVAKKQQEDGVLNYKGYSVVMNKDRCFALFSAANVNGAMRTDISGRNDAWLYDERIDRKYQIDNSYYAHDQFDRGHLTRREDMEWGTDPKDAVNKANGTCTWTNCTPQHAVFNEGKDPSVLLWAQLEHYVLEEVARAGHFKVQVITGPIFGKADPKYRDIAYPLEFWKVVAAVATKDGKDQLFATGYILGQKATIAKFGLEEALEVPFGEFGTYQRPISLIENLTGLRFTYGNNKPLSGVDPLAKPTWRPKPHKGAGPQEAFGVAGDDALESFEDIVLQ